MIELSHKNLEVWQISIDLVREVYTLSESFPNSENFGLTSQLRRSAVSIPSNIAEGCSRKSLTVKKRFFEIARSSLVELDTQIEIRIQLNYLSTKELDNLTKYANSVFAILTKLMSKNG